ncbi:MAG: hypothetical protein A2Z19_00055 [Deltaproteobacteria bacterium RBG_16_54_18]|nr:MAG: hypothetical protein A2Z19_00055 [Deltaproteobacteria bacterium RBG_16_54_18]
MQKPNLKIIISLAIIAVFVIGVLTYVSILGENDKIDRVIGEYFNNLKSGNYREACDVFSASILTSQGADDDRLVTFNFILELALLTHYNLMDQYDYTVELQRSRVWIPFVGNDAVQVGIVLKRKDQHGVSGKRAVTQQNSRLHDFITVVRERGSWKIRQFNITDSAIAEVYNELRGRVDLNRYIQRTSDGFQIKNADVNLTTLSSIDRRILRFSLYKIQKALGSELLPQAKTKNRLF